MAGIEGALAALASVGTTEGPEVQVLQDSLKRAKRASQEPPLSTQIAQTEAFVERAKKRLATHDAQREGLVQELESSQARLGRLRRLEVPTVVPGATDAESEIAALKAKLVQLQGEREEATTGATEDFRSLLGHRTDALHNTGVVGVDEPQAAGATTHSSSGVPEMLCSS